MVSNVANKSKGKRTPRGKGRIKKRINGNKTLRRISNSSFDMGRLTSDLISTPISKRQRTLTSLVQSKVKNKKRKLFDETHLTELI